MNKIIIVGIFLYVFLIVNIFPIEINIGSYDQTVNVILTDTKIQFTQIDYDDWDKVVVEEYDVRWETKNKVSYIEFNFTNYTGKINTSSGYGISRQLPTGLHKYLILTDNEIYFQLYDKNNVLVLELFNLKSDLYHLQGHSFATASSELTENGITYKANNLVDETKLLPWVEGVNGNGIGEKVKIELEYGSISGFTAFCISNGFVDYSRPYLYEYNNRVKKLRVWDGAYKEYNDIELMDTPQFQFFQVKFTNNSDILELEILEVYDGDKYDDTCINLICPVAF
jgi:hypothetical protein